MGLRRAVEMSPERWVYAQKIMDLVKRYAADLALEGPPHSIEYIERATGGFPRIRILREEAGHILVGRIAQHVCNVGLLGLTPQTQSGSDAYLTYITKAELTREETAAVQNSTFWSEHTRGPLLLLRGLLAGGILEFVFGSKRYRVNYGLTDRTPSTKLAVPYRAKDSPSPRSEFSHPEVVIMLTSLSYYYGGLSDEDLFVVLGHLIDSDRADAEWSAWLEGTWPGVEVRAVPGLHYCQISGTCADLHRYRNARGIPFTPSNQSERSHAMPEFDIPSATTFEVRRGLLPLPNHLPKRDEVRPLKPEEHQALS
jgi:hypothetical protein